MRHPARRHGGLAHLARRVLAAMLMSVCGLWLFALLCTRVYLFHNAYIHHVQTVENEKWLLFQCQVCYVILNLIGFDHVPYHRCHDTNLRIY